jgi:hypothetical protein
MRRHIAIKECTTPNHHAVTTALGAEAVGDDLGHHRQDTTKAQSMEEPEGPELPPRHTTMKTTKKRWERRALLIEFAPHQYPRVSNYPTISKNMMDIPGAAIMALRLPAGSQNIRGNKRDSNAKSPITPHRRS